MSEIVPSRSVDDYEQGYRREVSGFVENIISLVELKGQRIGGVGDFPISGLDLKARDSEELPVSLIYNPYKQNALTYDTGCNSAIVAVMGLRAKGQKRFLGRNST